ncbi:hypothetical protein L1987_70583 [Smallanthus sonchifolius]|uniref:Uncharacterized protein n=1 Tax=Smallanthus sonchifolius TaxID=185202 RepID=A0ACB9AP85_9ASTR|nr:hypothetical protein L1987_70583 [Smallanthus sonchifolius]
MSSEYTTAAYDGLNLIETELSLSLPGESRSRKLGVKRRFSDSIDTECSNASNPLPDKEQVFGWPPVTLYRKNSNFNLVKVAVDGAPYLRKVDLESYSGYQQLQCALVDICSYFTVENVLNEKVLMDHLVNRIKYVSTYVDKDGDWMLVGDVPWKLDGTLENDEHQIQFLTVYDLRVLPTVQYLPDPPFSPNHFILIFTRDFRFPIEMSVESAVISNGDLEKPFRIFVGYDAREDVAYEVCRYSILKRTSIPVEVIPIKQSELRKKNYFWRERNKLESTEFSFTRFLKPFLADYEGWAMFVDCDFLYLGDIKELRDLIDEKYALMCVQHDYAPKESTKMDGAVQTVYPSMMLKELEEYEKVKEKEKKFGHMDARLEAVNENDKIVKIEKHTLSSIPPLKLN